MGDATSYIWVFRGQSLIFRIRRWKKLLPLTLKHQQCGHPLAQGSAPNDSAMKGRPTGVQMVRPYRAGRLFST